MNYRRKVLLTKIESSYGVDAAPVAATDAVLVRNCSIRTVATELVDRELVKAYLGHDEQIPVSVGVAIDFENEMVGSGTAGTAAAWGKHLRACGFAETVNAGVDVSYLPVSSGFDSLTGHYHQDTLLHKALGNRGSLRMRMTTRQIPAFAFSYMGLKSTDTDIALPSPTLTDWQKPVAVNNANTSAFTLHGFAGKLYDFDIDLAAQLVHRNLVGGEDISLTDRAPVGNIEIEVPTIAAKDFFTIAKNGTLGAFSMTHGTVAGFKVKVDIPAVQLLNPEYTDRDGVLAMRMGLRLVPTAAGNDELKITAL
jgi:hypothetical protein